MPTPISTLKTPARREAAYLTSAIHFCAACQAQHHGRAMHTSLKDTSMSLFGKLKVTLGILTTVFLLVASRNLQAADRPNILLAISDDQSFAHTSMAGYKAIHTPAFDRVATEGIWFRNAFSPSPGCSPTRAALLTGRHTWQIEQAGTHASSFPKKYVTFPDLLESSGYDIGVTGKGWGPGNWKISGRKRSPAGPGFASRKSKPPRSGMSSNDYAANFADFLEQRTDGAPFFFWYGGSEPHRVFARGAGVKAGKQLADAEPPSFLPDAPEIRSDILDYCMEIEWFDLHLARMIAMLEQNGELDNTLIIVTSDNGMAFPRAKANLYEYGIHMPLAIRWGDKVAAGRTVDDLVGFVDLTATILDVADVEHPGGQYPLSGRSMRSILESSDSGIVDPSRTAVFAARERHSSSRYNNWTYPQRAIRTNQYLYIHNFRPDRWPAGDPVVLKDDGTSAGPHSGYKDIDACPSLDHLISHADDPAVGHYLTLAVAKRPAEELFDITVDPGCLNNLADDPDFADLRTSLWCRLRSTLRETGDARVIDGGDVWETYPRYSRIRRFPEP
jgi:N-sulfoglucosamine sulfohydrolase